MIEKIKILNKHLKCLLFETLEFVLEFRLLNNLKIFDDFGSVIQYNENLH